MHTYLHIHIHTYIHTYTYTHTHLYILAHLMYVDSRCLSRFWADSVRVVIDSVRVVIGTGIAIMIYMGEKLPHASVHRIETRQRSQPR